MKYFILPLFVCVMALVAVSQAQIVFAQMDPVSQEPTGTTTTGDDLSMVEGTVSSLGYCENNPAPAEDVSILIEGEFENYTATADASGFFQVDVPFNESPVDVTASATGHISATETGIELTESGQVTVDFDLRLDAPCAQVMPETLEASILSDVSVSEPLDILNEGVAEFTWAIGFEETDSQFRNEMIDVVADGGFELGTPNPEWDEASETFGTPLCDWSACDDGTGTGPNNGDWWTWFGGTPDGDVASIAQELEIPAGISAELSFFLEIPADGQPGIMDVSLGGDVLFNVTEADAASYETYQEVVIDVGEYADGGVYELVFSSETVAADGATNFFVDDVALEVQPVPPCMEPGDLSWASVIPDSGTVSGDSSETVEVSYDSTGLSAGQYQANLCLTTSDVEEELIVVPISLNVATITLANLEQVFTGNPLEPTITTDPQGLDVAVTYDGSPDAPVEAGSYPVEVTIDEASYTGSVSATFEITPAEATVAFADLEQVFTGEPLEPTITIDPKGLDRNVTYDGSPDAPIEIGEYLVEVVINEQNYSGSGTATFEILEAVAVELGVVASPEGDNALGEPLAPELIVELYDANGNLASDDSETVIEVSIAANPGGGTLGGLSSVTVENGVAVFDDLTISEPGIDYSLLVEDAADELDAEQTGTFNVFDTSKDIFHDRFEL